MNKQILIAEEVAELLRIDKQRVYEWFAPIKFRSFGLVKGNTDFRRRQSKNFCTAAEHKRRTKKMIEVKERKLRYKHTDQKRKAVSGTHGFQFDPKTFSKSMNMTKQIIQQTGKKNIVFFRQSKKRGGK